MKKEINGITLELRKGDITDQKDCKAVVNAANAMLQSGGGVAGAIHKAAGPELAAEAAPLAPIKPGEAVITKAYRLPNEFVIHCLGPVYGKDHPEDQLLAACYDRALDLAEQKKIESIAFPAISTGIFGYPIKEAANIALSTIISHIPHFKALRKVVIVLYSEEDFSVHAKAFEEITNNT